MRRRSIEEVCVPQDQFVEKQASQIFKMPSVTSLLFPILISATSVAASCNADNCLRALRAPAKLAEAQSFCATFTTASVAIPSYAAAACTGDVSSRVSSACSCIATSTISSTATPTSTSTSVPVTTTTSSSVEITSTLTSSSTSAPTSAPTGTPKVCLNPQLSCQNTTAVEDLCCFNSPGGQLLLTEFWDTAPSTGMFSPNPNSFTNNNLLNSPSQAPTTAGPSTVSGLTSATARTKRTATPAANTPTSPLSSSHMVRRICSST